MLENVKRLVDLKIPPNNMLEALKEQQQRENSIKINKKWRICLHGTMDMLITST
jgi:proteic killer suppression protein